MRRREKAQRSAAEEGAKNTAAQPVHIVIVPGIDHFALEGVLVLSAPRLLLLHYWLPARLSLDYILEQFDKVARIGWVLGLYRQMQELRHMHEKMQDRRPKPRIEFQNSKSKRHQQVVFEIRCSCHRLVGLPQGRQFSALSKQE